MSLETSVASTPENLTVEADSGSKTPSTRLWFRRFGALGLTFLAFLPFIVMFVKIIVDGRYSNWGDDALLELQTRDIGHLWVLLGPYSRFGFAHPGPVFFYLAAVPYWAFGGHAPGMNAAAVIINAAAFLGIARIAWRRGGMLLLAGTLLVLELFILQDGILPDFIRQPWNPYVTVLPFACFLFVAWEVARSERWALPVAVGLGSFLVQTHIGYSPEVLILGTVSMLLGWRGYRGQWKGADRRALRRALVVSAVVVVVLWLLPMVEQLTNHPGNVWRILSFQIHNRGDYGLFAGVGQVARFLGTFPAWALGRRVGSDGTAAGTELLAVPAIAAFFGAGLVVWRRRAGDAARYGVLTAASLLVAVLATMKITGPRYQYLVRWEQVTAMAAWIFPFVVASDVKVRTRRAQLYGLVATAVAILALTASGGNVWRTLHLGRPGGDPEPMVTQLSSALAPQLMRGQPVYIDKGSVDTHAYEYGVAAELVRTGHPVYFTPEFRPEVGSRRTATPPPQTYRIVFGTNEDLSRLEALPGAERLGASNGVFLFHYS